MKLSKREKMLLLILLAVAFFVGGYFLLLEPQMREQSQVQIQYDEAKLKLAEQRAMSDPNNPIYAQYDILDNKVRLSTVGFFPNLDQERIITMLETRFYEAGIMPMAVQFTVSAPEIVNQIAAPAVEQPGALDLLAKAYLDTVQSTASAAVTVDGISAVNPDATAPAAPEAAVQTAGSGLKAVRISASFQTTYEALQTLLKRFEEYPRRIMVEQITTAKSGDGELSVTMVIALHSIPKIHQQDEDYMQWSFEGPYGRENPFAEYDGYSSGADSGPITPAAIAAQKYDFVMRLNPIVSDASTVVLSRNNDKSGKTAVFADNAGFEDVEIEFIQKDNRYYYHYTTANQSYPTNYGEMVEFKPAGESINILVGSTPRSSKEDKSGAAVSLLNKTNLKVIVFPLDDDPTEPRFKVVKTFGDVKVN